MSASPRRLARVPVIRAYDHEGALTILGDDGDARRFLGESADLARAMLEILVVPRTEAELLAELSTLAEAPVALEGAVGETLRILEATGAVGPASAPRSTASGPRVRLVVAIAGAVAAAFTPGLVEMLLGRGFEVRVAVTGKAKRFVSTMALGALTHHDVVESLWPKDPRAPVPHLDLASWAELMVVYPASATTLARIAQGSCATVVSAAAISTRAKVVLFPSMNSAMYAAPSVQRNLAQLREDGFLVVHPALGIEVADAPDARSPMFGPAPPVAAAVDLIQAIAAQHVVRREESADWDLLHRQRRPDELPWFTEALDGDLARLLGAPAPGRRRVLDLGTGLGTAAIEAARRGFSVVATDVSPRALTLAQGRAGELPVTFVVDDVLASRLVGSFDVVLDRGLLHVLPRARHAEYAAAVGRLARPGGVLLLKCHASAAEDLGTRRFTRGEVAELFGQAFELTYAEESILPGPDGRAPAALVCELRRR